MRKIFAILLASAAAVALAWWIFHLHGKLSLDIGTLTIEAPVSVVVTALLLLAFIVHLLSRLWHHMTFLPQIWRHGGERSKRRRGDDAVTATLVALAAQDAKTALKAAQRATKYLGATPQTLLLTAYAGGIAGDATIESAAFEALSQRQDAAFLGWRGLLRLAVANGDLTTAAIMARHAQEAYPQAEWLRTDRLDYAIRTSAWADALALAKDDGEKAAFGTALAAEQNDAQTALKLAREANKRQPTLAAAAIEHARALRMSGKDSAGFDILRRCWGQAPNPDLAAAALAGTTDKQIRLKRGTDLVRDAKRHPESQLLLARLLWEAGVIGEAQRMADAARGSGLGDQRIFALLADIAAASNNNDAAVAARRNHDAAPPAPGWSCEACGADTEQWVPACPHCHAGGKITWGKILHSEIA